MKLLKYYTAFQLSSQYSDMESKNANIYLGSLRVLDILDKLAHVFVTTWCGRN